MFRAMFLDAAPGRIKRELMIKRPTHEIARVTTTAMMVVNVVCTKNVENPLEDANWG